MASSVMGLMALLLSAQIDPWGHMVTYHARIIVEEGVAPPTSPQITPDPPLRCDVTEVFGSGQIDFIVDQRGSGTCPVTIRLQGYRKNQAVLRNESVIVMRRPGSYANLTVSITTLQAPEEAQNAYGKGISAMLRKKWAAAQKAFETAVAAYPDYAPAWDALGRVHLERSQPQNAKEAFEKAAKADPKFAPAWAHLTHLAAGQGKMRDVLQAAERTLQLDSTGFPEVYIDRALADLSLQSLDAAEHSARKAIEIDTFHEIPRAERVLGTVLAAKGDRKGAVEQWQKYLEMSPKADDAAEIRKLIAQAEMPPAPAPPPR